MIQRFLIALIIASMVIWAGGTPTSQAYDHAAHYFTIFPEWDYVEGYGWPVGATVTGSVLGKPECTMNGLSVVSDWDPAISFVWFAFPETCDITTGDQVSLSDGEIIATHTVQPLTISLIDEQAEVITGSAAPGETVYVWAHSVELDPLTVMADEEGEWTVEFGGVYDLLLGEWGRAEVRDEDGSSTAIDWHIFNPRFTAFPDWDYIEAWDWPVGATISASVTGKPECSIDGVATIKDEPWPMSFLGLKLPAGCDLVNEDELTLTDATTTTEHRVRHLTITSAHAPTNTVAGRTEPGEVVFAWPHQTRFITPVQANAGSDGAWEVNFTEMIDIPPGIWGRAEVRDEAGNATAVDWFVDYAIYIPFVARD
jgi:hypothetical protein